MAVYVLMCVFFILIAGLRYRIGGDSLVYESAYKSSPTFAELFSFKFSNQRWEPGYFVVASITRSFSSDFTYFQLFHALIVNSIIFWFVCKNTENKFLAITLYFTISYFNLNTEILRESLAVCCFLIAWPFFKNGRWYFYYPLMFLACYFHVSATFTLIFPLLALPGIRAGFKLGYRTIFICIILFAVGYILQRKFFGIVQMLASNQTMEERAMEYSKNSFGGVGLNVFGMLEHILKTILIPVLALWWMKSRIRHSGDPSAERWINKIEIIVIAGVYFAVLTLWIFIANRINNYICMFNYVVIASCFFTTLPLARKKFRIQGVYWGFIFMFILILNGKGYFASTYGSSSNKRYMIYYPYSSQLDPQEDPNREQTFRYLRHQK